MIIYSWNILCFNKKLDSVFDVVKQTTFDIFCFQEVPESFLKRLESLPYYSTYCIDTETKNMRIYNVTLSKYPIVEKGEISFKDQWETLPFRTYLFIFMMKPFNFTKLYNRKGLYTDIKVGDALTRVFNIHLALAHPGQRLEELKHVMKRFNVTQKTIICGDFNILEVPHITILNWLLGGHIRDAFLYKRERSVMEKYFAQHRLLNPLYSKSTHPLSLSQLDHILVSDIFSVERAHVFPDRMGSDHHPICVEIR